MTDFFCSFWFDVLDDFGLDDFGLVDFGLDDFGLVDFGLDDFGFLGVATNFSFYSEIPGAQSSTSLTLIKGYSPDSLIFTHP